MWNGINQLETKDLQRLHDVMFKAVSKSFDTVKANDLPIPAWLNDAAQAVKDMYAELWSRREEKKGES